ncbi:TatD family hydrolase [Chryseobacterium sp. MP_3.2]|uniref:TatD family hydrolase n=1 Tax=Chryseobacterium sp. MP_3.2 TaxID=3071712 RepID=UPI002E08B884|nr:TatD DNase family protein [Chryseobacterium sp. MP_3.2]
MKFFNFHHHNPHEKHGIFNIDFGQDLHNSSFSTGIHPKSILPGFEEQLLWLQETAQLKNCLAIGECGLDGLINVADQLQEEIFSHHISLANQLQKPLIIHCVKRFQRMIQLCKKAEVPMVLHGFNKKKSVGLELIANDFYLSFGTSVLENVNLQEFLKEVPLQKILLETDTTDFEIEKLYQKVADLKCIPLKVLGEQIEENLKTLKIIV